MLIITTQPGAADTAMGELQKLNPGARVKKILSPEARLVEYTGRMNERLSKAQCSNLETAAPVFPSEALHNLIFTRHVCPVGWFGETTSADWQSILPDRGAETFSVQLRVAPRDDAVFARGKEIVRTAEEMLTGRGFIKDDRHPVWALSFFMADDGVLYAGFSRTADNLSEWNGGAVRFKKDESFISRAEFKLLEAFEVLVNIKPFLLSPGAAALDLGAAPGGWTRALLNMGCQVTAVDPAEMHESLINRPGLTHLRAAVQGGSLGHLLGHPPGVNHPRAARGLMFEDASFDLITNDMRMDMFDSARVMLGAARYLKPGGLAVMTLKLSPGHWMQKTAKVLKLLDAAYTNIRARQLFHNRDEVTAVMRVPMARALCGKLTF